MAGRKAAAAVRVDDFNATPDSEVKPPKHVFRVGELEFACADELPLTTFVRYLNAPTMTIVHHVLNKIVLPAQREAMWDAVEAVEYKDMLDSYNELIASYSARPTKRPASSRGGSLTIGNE